MNGMRLSVGNVVFRILVVTMRKGYTRVKSSPAAVPTTNLIVFSIRIAGEARYFNRGIVFSLRLTSLEQVLITNNFATSFFTQLI